MNLNVNIGTDKKPKEPSSIDRFFWTRRSSFYGNNLDQAGLAAWIISGSFGIGGLIFFILWLSVKGFPVVFSAIFGPIGLAALAIAIALQIRGKKPVQTEVKLSSAGRKMMHRIGNHIGWFDPDQMRGYQRNAWSDWWQSVWGIKTASDILKPKSVELLEAGCIQYNRLAGLLKLAKDTHGRSSNMAPQIQAAGEEAMRSLVNSVGLIEDNPEAQDAIVNQCSIQISKLKELADRYEEMLSGPVTLADRLSSTTVIDDVLDQLRMEAQAKEELRIMEHQE